MKYDNESQLSPCIIAKVKDAFLGANKFNRNKKRCTQNYWNEACNKLGISLNKSNEEINNAKEKFSSYNK